MTELLLVLALLFPGAQDKARVLDLLEASGRQYEKAGNGWAIKFAGKNNPDIRVITVQTDNLAVIISFVIMKNQVADGNGLHRALLEFNEDYDFVKTLVDDDGDYAVRLEMSLFGLDQKTFNAQLEQVAASADLLKPIVDQYRKK